MIERDLRIAVWNGLRHCGVADDACYPIINAVVGEFLKSPTIAAIGLVLQADQEAAGCGLRYGLADCVDNDGQPYQSAGLAQALLLLRKDFPQEAGASAAADAPTPNSAPSPEGGADVAAGSKLDAGDSPTLAPGAET